MTSASNLSALVDHALRLSDDNRARAIVLLTRATALAVVRFANAETVPAVLTLSIETLTEIRDRIQKERGGRPS